MAYSVKEVVYTLQGEGAQTGRAAIFCRFVGCNLWSGREEDRASAVCNFCDTDFLGTDGARGGQFASAADLAGVIRNCWKGEPSSAARPLVVFTGGEPLLQLDGPLIAAVKQHGFEIALETNGTLPLPAGLDWVCVSPKADSQLVVREGNELKLVFPQVDVDPARFLELAFEHFYLQPMAGPDEHRNWKLAVEYCLQHPRWKLSLQTHKLLNIP